SGKVRTLATAIGCCSVRRRTWRSSPVRRPWRTRCSPRPGWTVAYPRGRYAGKSNAAWRTPRRTRRSTAMREACYQTAAEVLASWRDDVLSGNAPTLYPAGAGALRRIEIGPGLVVLLGGAPGAGKTAFTMQLLVDALRLTPTLRGVVCNVEMPPAVLLDRQLARLSGIDLSSIRHRRLGAEHADRIEVAMNT